MKRTGKTHGAKIRILHVAQAAGGVDRYLRMLFKYLDKDKFENILVCSQDFKASDYIGLADGFEVLQMTRAIGSNDLSLVFALRKLIRKYEPDIVYAHSSKAGAVARMADIGIKNICIYNPHGWAFNMRTSTARKQRAYALIERIAAPFCRKIICISESEKKAALEKKICKKDKLQVIYNGVDIEEYKNAPHGAIKRSDLNIPEDAFIIGTVGRLTPQKAPDVFIKAAKEIKASIPEAYFIIVGNGGMEEGVRDYAKKNGLEDSLLITGWVDEPLQYVELFDVALLLSRWEGFGLALPEYMMVGKPIIATSVDAIPEIVEDGENGLLIDVDDIEGIRSSVKKLYEDKELQESLVKAGRQIMNKRFNAKRVAKEHEAVFLKLCGQ